MARPRLGTGLLVALAAFAASTLYRRRTARRRAHVDLYFADGSMVSLQEGSADATRLLALAHELLHV